MSFGWPSDGKEPIGGGKNSGLRSIKTKYCMKIIKKCVQNNVTGKKRELYEHLMLIFKLNDLDLGL